VEVLEGRDVPSVFTVTNPNDAGAGSLRDAVAAANFAGGDNTIQFALGAGLQTITLTSGQLELTDTTGTTTIDGGAGVTVSGSSAGRLFQVDPQVTAQFTALTLTGGKVTGDRGGAILNQGTLLLNNCAVDANTAPVGGGIANLSILAVAGSSFANNVSLNDNSVSGIAFENGGAIYNAGTLTVADSTFTSNTGATPANFVGTRGGVGGAIENDGVSASATVTDSTFSNNVATGNGSSQGGAKVGGGIANVGGTVTVIQSSFTQNVAQVQGGAIAAFGSTSHLEVDDSSFSGNSSLEGGALFVEGAIALNRDSFTSNSAFEGGAVWVHESPHAPMTTVNGCTFTGNTAADSGAMRVDTGPATITSSTFTANRATSTTIGLGGALVSDLGDTALIDVTMTGNSSAFRGGAIGNGTIGGGDAVITIVRGTISNNSAAKFGGAIANLGTQTPTQGNGKSRIILSGTTLDHNSSGGEGGAIDNIGPLSDLQASNATLTNNSAATVGGAVANAGKMALDGTLLQSNQAAIGGAVENAGTEADSQSTFQSNTASSGAGGATDNHGSASEMGVTMIANSAESASGNGGAISNAAVLAVVDALMELNSAAAIGGAISNLGQLTMKQSTLERNSAGADGGAVASQGSASISESTISDNSAAGSGGGVEASTGELDMGDSTVANNSAGPAGSGGGGDVGNAAATVTNSTIVGNSAGASGGGIHAGTGTVRMGNTLVARNQSASAADVQGDSGESVVSNGHNLIGDGSGSSLVNGVNGDQVGTTASPIDPLLAPLANYGGLTQTFALLPGSPAVDAGDNAQAVDAANQPLTTDQRGLPRVVTGTVDIGAFESSGFVLQVVSGDNQTVPVNAAFNPLVVSVSGFNGEPVNGGQVTFTGPASGAGVTPAVSVVTIASAQASDTMSADALPGSYSVIASARGASSVAFHLNNTLVATHFVVTAPASVVAGVPFTFTVQAEDQNNNVVTTYAGTVHFTSTDGRAVLPADVLLTSGAGTFTAILKTAGTQTISVTDTTTQITGTSNLIVVERHHHHHGDEDDDCDREHRCDHEDDDRHQRGDDRDTALTAGNWCDHLLDDEVVRLLARRRDDC
jgi:predicted outer membrane repeat protein